MRHNLPCDANFRLVWKNSGFMKTKFMTVLTNERRSTLLWTSHIHCTCCQFLKLDFNIILRTKFYSPLFILYSNVNIYMIIHFYLSQTCFVLYRLHAPWFNHIIEIPWNEFLSVSFRTFLYPPVISSVMRPASTDHQSNVFPKFLNPCSVCFHIHDLILNSFFNKTYFRRNVNIRK
jgi:hypothetical protein